MVAATWLTELGCVPQLLPPPSHSPESAVNGRVIAAPQVLQVIGYRSVSDQFAKPSTFQPGASDRSD